MEGAEDRRSIAMPVGSRDIEQRCGYVLPAGDSAFASSGSLQVGHQTRVASGYELQLVFGSRNVWDPCIIHVLPVSMGAFYALSSSKVT